MSSNNEPVDNVFVARQPIFDRQRNVWGYELLFRLCGGDCCALITDPEAATSSVVADGFSLGTRGLAADKKICLNLSLRSVLDHVPEALPPGSVVLEVSAPVDAAGLEALAELKAQGHVLCLDNYRGEPEQDALLALADLVKISFADHDPGRIMAMRGHLKAANRVLVAAKVEDWQAFEGAKALGFDYFQGFFFARPEMVSGRRIDSGQAARLRLIRALGHEAAEVDELTRIVSSDQGLAHRLLRFINSPAFGLQTRVGSIAHAVSLLGLRPLRGWAMVAVMSELDSSERGREVNWFALHRAVFLKLAAEQGLAGDADPEAMFLMGLFSNLDAVLGVSMAVALEELPLDDVLKDALLHRSGTGAAWLVLLEELESGRLGMVRDGLERLAIPANQAAMLYMRATALASAAVGADGGCRALGSGPPSVASANSCDTQVSRNKAES